MQDNTLILPNVPEKALDNADFFTKFFQNDINGFINGEVQPIDRQICKRRPSFGSEAFSPNKRRGYRSDSSFSKGDTSLRATEGHSSILHDSSFSKDHSSFSRDHSSDPSREHVRDDTSRDHLSTETVCAREYLTAENACTRECMDTENLYSQEIKDRISHLTDVYTRRILEHIERSTCTEQIQSELPAILSNLCHELISDDYTLTLGKKIDHLMHEKSALCNIIKSQYETISRLRDVEITAVRSAQEGQAYKAELVRLREMVTGCSSQGSFNDELDRFRKPPDVC